MLIRSRSFTVALAALAVLSACSKDKGQAPAPVVMEMKQSPAQENPGEPVLLTKPTAKISATLAQQLKATSRNAIVTEVTLRKSSLLNRTFLYGASLQFSAIPEDDINVTLMAIALGQTPVEFQVVDNALRLMTDARINFESDVNTPARLVHEFPILKQDEETITVKAEHGSPIVDTFLFGNKNNVAKRASFIRSMAYAEPEELILIESTVELVDGSLAEIMETISPRDKQIAGAANPIYNDADSNPLAERYRFLDGGKVFIDKEGKRVETTVAQRFLQRNGEPIRWYATRNTPEKYLNDVKNSVEAWNRYSRAAGTGDLVRFEGLVPEGVKVGDPRYNIIVWDNIQDAGAAYESQGADPLTGVQSHSLIYIPLAWINIGKDYWVKGGLSDAPSKARTEAMAKALKNRTFMGRRVPVNCMDDAHLHVTAESKLDPETFARELLKGVIFHEMGHALGLAHNFKGSLSFDPDTNEKMFTTSIMDYNHYNEEARSFYGVDSADGPLLEYDRQIISVLYNEGKDVKESDATVPACNDEEADSFTGGVDPLCVRYDIGSDPTKQALRSLDLISKQEARNGRMQSLPLALRSTLEGLGDPSAVKTVDDAKKAVAKLGTVVNGTINIYVGGTANSLAYLGSQALKSIYVFRADVLPEGYVEAEMRERAVTMLETVMGTNALPAASKESLAAVKEGMRAFLLNTQAVAGLGDSEKEKAVQDLLASLDKSFATTEAALLSKARTRLLSTLVYQAEAPISFVNRNGNMVDLEAEVTGLLERMIGPKAGEVNRPAAERLAAIKSRLAVGGGG